MKMMTKTEIELSKDEVEEAIREYLLQRSKGELTNALLDATIEFQVHSQDYGDTVNVTGVTVTCPYQETK